MKMIVWIMAITLFTLVLFFLWASYPWSLSERKLTSKVAEVETESILSFNTFDEQAPAVIKILTFNLSFLYGSGSEGSGYEFRHKDFFIKALEKVSQEIKEKNPDIVCLQEVDFSSSRSHHLNQAKLIAQKVGLPFVAMAPSWEAKYVPFPYWPLKNQFGQMNSGGAVLSRYPIVDHEILLLQKPKSNPWWYNLFYLHRYFQKVSIMIGDKKYQLINLHLEAFDKKDRQEQVDQLVKMIKEEKTDFVVGDFNMVPSVALKKSGFIEHKDDYEDDKSYEILKSSSFFEVIPEEIYAKSESLYFTFPSWRPDRRLDYIWYKQGLKMMKAEVLPSALSDHLPLLATFQISGIRVNPYSQ